MATNPKYIKKYINGFTRREYTLLKLITDPKRNADSLAELAVEAGFSKRSAGVIVSQLLQKDNVQNFLSMAMEKQGITDDALAANIKDGIGANRPLIINSEITEYPDWNARHRFVDMALKIKRAYPDKPDVNINNSNTGVSINLNIASYSANKDNVIDADATTD